MTSQPLTVPEAGRAAFEALLEHESLTAVELAGIVNRHEGNVRKYLAVLREAGMVRRNADRTYSVTPEAGGPEAVPLRPRTPKPRPPRVPRTTAVTARIPNEAMAVLDHAAQAAGITRAEAVRKMVLVALENTTVTDLEGRLAS